MPTATATTSSILIVNADDFGLTEGTSHAIIDAHRTGIVTSTSLLANAYAFDHAVRLAQENPSLRIGVHLTLTEGPSVASNVDALLANNGQFPLSNQPFARALVTGRLPHEAIRREFEAQINKVIQAGIRPTHVDGHKYIHLLPGISSIVAELAHQFQIPVMRIPHRLIDKPSHLNRIPGTFAVRLLGMLALQSARRWGLKSADRVAGFVDTGHLTETSILRLLTPIRPSVTELLCHPAYKSDILMVLLSQGYRWIAGYDFESETTAVSNPQLKAYLERLGWSFAGFDAF